MAELASPAAVVVVLLTIWIGAFQRLPAKDRARAHWEAGDVGRQNRAG